MPATTLWRLVVDGETIEETKNLTYNSDILAVGEELRYTVVNDGAKYVGRLLAGSIAEVYALNADVLGGHPTLKFRGRIIERRARLDERGNLIELAIYDLGWHLTNCCAPLWFRLDRAVFLDLLDPEKTVVGKGGRRGYFLDPSFGFTGLRTDGLKRRLTKQGKSVVEAQQTKDVQPVYWVQVEPGEKFLQRLVEYAKRENRLINVSPTGELQAFLPDYTQSPLYSFDQRTGNPANNIISAEEIVNCSTRWTEVEVVGQQLGYQKIATADPQNPNATKNRGAVSHPEANPFVNRLTVANGDMYTRGLAQKLANWLYMRGKWDAYALRITVSGHHQNGNWYEADTMCSVDIEGFGVQGAMYVAAAQYTVDDRQGDICTLTLRKPNLLTASFGVYPQPKIPSAEDKGQPKEEQKT